MKAVTSVMMVAMKYEQLKETNLSECFQAFYYDNVNHKSTTTAKVSCTISGVLLWSKGKPRDDIVENSLSLQVLLILYLSLSLSVLTRKRALKICQFDKLPILNPLQSVTIINDQPSDYFKKFFFFYNERGYTTRNNITVNRHSYYNFHQNAFCHPLEIYPMKYDDIQTAITFY